MRLAIHNSVAIVEDASDAEIAWLRGSPEEKGFLDFRFPARGAFGVATEERRCVFQTARDGRHFMPAGIVPLVRSHSAKRGFAVEVRDLREPPCDPDFDADIAWLMPHQRAAVMAVARHTRGIIKIATSGGKGEVAVALGKFLPCRWLFAAYSYDLVDDAARRWEKRGDGSRPGRIGDGNFDLGDGRFVCATWQTLLARAKDGDATTLELLRGTEGLIAEECHTVPSTTASTVGANLENAYWRVGLSGTPLDRTDQKSILAICLLGPVIHKVAAKELVDLGVSAACTVRMIRCVQPRSERQRWSAIYKELVVRSQARNEAIVRAAELAEKPALLFFREVKHGHLLAKMLRKRGISCDLSYGEDPTEIRKQKLRWAVREGNAVLLVNKTFQMGEVDPCIVEIRSVINGGGGASKIATLQQLGRGMRRFDAQGREVKTAFALWDIEDEIEGHETMRSLPAIMRHARDRVKAYRSAGHPVERIE